MRHNPKNIPLFPEIKTEYITEIDVMRRVMSTQIRKKDTNGKYRRWTIVDSTVIPHSPEPKNLMVWDASIQRFMDEIALAMYFTRLDLEPDKIVFADGDPAFGEDQDQRPTSEILKEGYLVRKFGFGKQPEEKNGPATTTKEDHLKSPGAV